jgi:hypothetical protein
VPGTPTDKAVSSSAEKKASGTPTEKKTAATPNSKKESAAPKATKQPKGKKDASPKLPTLFKFKFCAQGESSATPPGTTEAPDAPNGGSDSTAKKPPRKPPAKKVSESRLDKAHKPQQPSEPATPVILPDPAVHDEDDHGDDDDDEALVSRKRRLLESTEQPRKVAAKHPVETAEPPIAQGEAAVEAVIVSPTEPEAVPLASTEGLLETEAADPEPSEPEAAAPPSADEGPMAEDPTAVLENDDVLQDCAEVLLPCPEGPSKYSGGDSDSAGELFNEVPEACRLP